MEHPGNASTHSQPAGLGPYRALLGMTVLSYIAMYLLMYAMVDRWNNVFNNVNQLYMAGLMASPMALIELVLMRGMYRNRLLNAAIAITALLLMLLCWIGIRTQAAVTDQQFVRSMIPHHAGAILMCGKNRLRDPDLQQLCREIVQSQQAEIERMEAELR
ncbi:DUF305 domain-containing protein [Lysobacter sp. Root494]|uniref:DUF305 domain-containing protein n=1 Tax=Lysobacter sp. Root494 TaxID=1736549 RepID=UPI0006FD048A|nr:DUF305 domain-containing protein [Lysobacter sp. Root494]KQY55009.1 hypothetical protein ASD14_02280 [Lysobacter sp. Root494]